MNHKVLAISLLTLLLAACGDEPIPKPKGELRLDYEERIYRAAETNCPYNFDLSDKSLMRDAASQSGRCWKDIYFPKQRAILHLTYVPINNNLGKLLKDTRELTYEHHIKASNIESEVIVNQDQQVYGLVYEVSGNVASTSQFYLTDSTKHFVRGALYFNCKPNWDSLMPAVKYIEEDIDQLIASFSWKD